MKKCVILLVVLLAGCEGTPPGVAAVSRSENIRRWHDDSLNVTCWLWPHGYGSGMSCIPDNQLGESR